MGFFLTKYGISPNTNFDKLKIFFYNYFCDDEFRELPVTALAELMQENGRPISRQTMRSYIRHFNRNYLIMERSGNFIYYSVSYGERTEITKEQYSAAWREYWRVKKAYNDYSAARRAMYRVSNGYACKHEIADINGIYWKEISYLLDTICESFCREDNISA